MFNEYSKIAQVAIRNPESGFVNDKKLASEWKRLRFHSKPNFKDAVIEFTKFRELLEDDDIKIIDGENDGTAIGMAIASSINRLRYSKTESKIIILLSDGSNNKGELDSTALSRYCLP